MSKKIIIICVILLIAILIVVGILSKGKKTFYETDELKKCTISQTVEASGTINPVNTVSVGSTVSGLIKEIYVEKVLRNMIGTVSQQKLRIIIWKS